MAEARGGTRLAAFRRRVAWAADNAARSSTPFSERHGQQPPAGGLWRLTLGALGIVFGDIGTSSLYTLEECLLVAGRDRPVEQADLFGLPSLAVRFGYMEQPLLMPCLRRIAAAEHLPIDVDTATFSIGHSTVVADHAGQLSFIPEAIFAYLKRNAVREEQRYGLPAGQVMEIGEQISI